MSKERENPEGVGSPPVALVSIDYDSGVPRNTLCAHDFGESRAIDVVTHDGVIEICVPVNLDRPGDMSYFVQEDVLVRLDDDNVRFEKASRQPFRTHERLGVSVLSEFRVVIWGYGHESTFSSRQMRRDKSE